MYMAEQRDLEPRPNEPTFLLLLLQEDLDRGICGSLQVELTETQAPRPGPETPYPETPGPGVPGSETPGPGAALERG